MFGAMERTQFSVVISQIPRYLRKVSAAQDVQFREFLILAPVISPAISPRYNKILVETTWQEEQRACRVACMKSEQISYYF